VAVSEFSARRPGTGIGVIRRGDEETAAAGDTLTLEPCNSEFDMTRLESRPPDRRSFRRALAVIGWRRGHGGGVRRQPEIEHEHEHEQRK
jgi:hypothetical protein